MPIIDFITPILKLIDKLPKSEQTIVTQLINDLSNHAVIYTDAEMEFSCPVSKSIERISDKIHTYTMQLRNGSAIQSDLVNLQKICLEFLHQAKKISIDLKLYFERIKGKIAAYENKQVGAYEITDNDRLMISYYEYIGEVDLLTNDKINITNIFPDGNKMAYLKSFFKFQKDFGDQLYVLAAKAKATLPTAFKPSLPFQNIA